MEIVFTQKKKSQPHRLMVLLAFILLLCSFGAEIIDDHQNNLWSLSAQKYFWLIEPEIIKKILIGFLPVRANKPFAFVPFSVPNCRIARINTVMNYRVILLSHKTEKEFFFFLFLKRITMINYNSFLKSTRP